jgi:peptide/nickel transport system substrate-binding protein
MAGRYLVFVLLAVLVAPAFAAPAAKDLDEIVVIQGEETSTLDVHLDWTVTSRNIYYNLFSYLVVQDEKFVPRGELAERWEWTDDRTVRWHLRKGVKFTNGEPANAHAVKFSLDRILDPKSKAPWIAAINFVESVTVKDDYTIDVRSKISTPTLITEVGRMAIIPPKYFQEKGPSYFAENPVGSGPFKFKEWVKGEKIVLERNPDYWRGPSAIKRVVFRWVPEASTRVAELLAGRGDIVVKVPNDLINQVETSKAARTVTIGSIQNVQLGLNTFRPPLDNVLLRRAIAHAIDTDSIIKNVLLGRAQRTPSPLSPLVWGVPRNFKGIPYDPNRAKALLAEAKLPPDTKLVINYGLGRIPQEGEIAQAIAGDLAKAGIKVDVVPQEWGTFWGLYESSKLPSAFLHSWTATIGDPDQILKNVDSTRTAYYYRSPEMDRLVAKQRSMTDEKVRLPVIRQILDKMSVNVVWVGLFDVQLIYGVSNKLEWQPRPNELIWLWPAKPR